MRHARPRCVILSVGGRIDDSANGRYRDGGERDFEGAGTDGGAPPLRGPRPRQGQGECRGVRRTGGGGPVAFRDAGSGAGRCREGAAIDRRLAAIPATGKEFYSRGEAAVNSSAFSTPS